MPSFFPLSLKILLILPPEPIKSIFLCPSVTSLIHCSTSFHVLCPTSPSSKRTVPNLKEREATTSPPLYSVNSVLPPPTSTYKYDRSEVINDCKSVLAMIAASSLPSIIFIDTPVFFLITFTTSLPLVASRIAEVAQAL